MTKPSCLFLLRAYGDFTIALSIAAHSPNKEQFLVVASKHLEPLYTALAPHLSAFVPIRFIDFGIDGQLMRCFTNKFILHPHTFRELSSLRRFVQEQLKDETLYLEQQKRIFFPRIFCGKHFKPIVTNAPVYKSYARFLSVSLTEFENIPFDRNLQGKKVLILPDSRQPNKIVNTILVKKLQDQLDTQKAEVILAFFQKAEVSITGNKIVYNNFQELINLINNTDLLIGGDSLPVHIAQILYKPHYILYPASKTRNFFTPFSVKNNTYFSFDEIKTRDIFS